MPIGKYSSVESIDHIINDRLSYSLEYLDLPGICCKDMVVGVDFPINFEMLFIDAIEKGLLQQVGELF